MFKKLLRKITALSTDGNIRY